MSGVVSTMAGSGSASYGDGVGVAAMFNGPVGLSLDSSGTLYVGDRRNNRIRKISTTGLSLKLHLI